MESLRYQRNQPPGLALVEPISVISITINFSDSNFNDFGYIMVRAECLNELNVYSSFKAKYYISFE